LIPAGYSQNVEQLDRIFREMSKQENRLDPIIILSGQQQGLREFLNSNDGVKSKFRFVFSLPDFNSTELTQLTKSELLKHGFNISEDAREKLTRVFKLILKQSRMPDYEPEARNAWLALKVAENIKNNYYLRVTGTGPSERIILPDDIKGEIEKEKTLEQILAEIDSFIGMYTIKKTVRNLIDEIAVHKQRAASGVSNEKAVAFHIVLTGNPGTGKTTVARKLGEIFKAIGVLELGHVIDVDRSKMVAQFVGQTAPQVNGLCDKAMGGILFIDEAYSLKQNDGDTFGQEAIDTLLKRMEDDRGKFVVVIAGYPKEIISFLNANPGLQSRFDERYRFHLDDYTPDELLAIFKKSASEEDYNLDIGAEEIVRKQFIFRCSQKDKNFGNGREARNLFEACRSLHSQRLALLQKTESLDKVELTCIRAQDVPTKQSSHKDVGAILLEIEKLVGLNTVKKEIRSLISYLQVEKMRAERGGKETRLNLHFVFRGNPGTGKTTVARIVADIFKDMGLLPKGNLIEVDRAGLVAQYVGQTAPKTNAVIDTSMGGVLFIDEAYALSGDTFGKEAIDTLLKRMEDDKGKFIVIAAGYSREMDDFLNSNSGLTSRFTKFIDFEDYNPSELKAIYKSMLSDKGMILDRQAEQRVESLLGAIYENRGRSFANGRTVRNIFEKSLQNQSVRIGPFVMAESVTADILNTITAEDITE
jgi:SpoVK/Ycf46/Vps4 family AAA+-type ATPase